MRARFRSSSYELEYVKILLLIAICSITGAAISFTLLDYYVFKMGMAQRAIACFNEGFPPVAITTGTLVVAWWLWQIVRVKMVQCDLKEGLSLGLIFDAHLVQQVACNRDALVQRFAWIALVGLGFIALGIMRLNN